MSYRYCPCQNNVCFDSSIYLIIISNSSSVSLKCSFFDSSCPVRNTKLSLKKKQTWASQVLCRDCQNQTSFLRTPFQDAAHPFHDNVTKTIFHILSSLPPLTRFGIIRKCNNCVMYKHFSSNFFLLLFINVTEVSRSQFLNIWLPLCSKNDIRA